MSEITNFEEVNFIITTLKIKEEKETDVPIEWKDE